MNKLTLAVAALMLTGISYAQNGSTATTSSSASGVLGTTYADVGLALDDIDKTSDNAYKASLTSNLAVSNGIDFALRYDYWWYNYEGGKAHSHLLSAIPKFYWPVNGVKPYVGAMAGYEWAKQVYGPFTTDDDFGVWGLLAGVEIPAGMFVLTPHYSYRDYFQHRSNTTNQYGVEGHYWFNEKLGGYADVSYNDIRHQHNSWSYTIGLRFRY